MKKEYVMPEILAVNCPEPIAETMPMSEDDSNESKEQKEFIEEEEPLPVDKNIWEDEEE